MGKYRTQLKRRIKGEAPLARRARRQRYSVAEREEAPPPEVPVVDLADFVRDAWEHVESDALDWNWHHQLLCDTLQAFALDELLNDAGEIVRRLCINIAPGTAKSLIVSVFYPTWRLTRDPSYSVITAANAMPLAIRDCLKANELVKSEWFRERWGHHVGINRRIDAKTQWATTRGGFRIATSTGSNFTGWRAHEIIVDDILDAWDRHSKKKRDAALEWLLTKMTSRVRSEKTGKILVIGQRLHSEDPYGRRKDDKIPGGGLQHRKEWNHLILPMKMTPRRHRANTIPFADPRKAGEFLQPSRFGQKEWARAGSDLGSQQREAQLQQTTSDHQGTIYKRTWWKRYKTLPGPVPDRIVTTWDASFGGLEEHHAYVAGEVWAIYGNDAYLIDMYRRRAGFVETYKAINHMHAKWSPAANLVENASNGKAIVQFFERTEGMAPVIPIDTNNKAKEVRWHAAAPFVEGGRAYLPEDELEGVLGHKFWKETDTNEVEDQALQEAFDATVLIDEAADVPEYDTCDTVDAFAQFVIWAFLRYAGTQMHTGQVRR